MKTILALLALSFSAAASATACYQIYSPSNTLVWQGQRPPISMDRPDLDEEVKKMVPGGHLIVIDDRSVPCQSIDATSKRPFSQAGKDSGGQKTEIRDQRTEDKGQ
ncbi:MAG: hypothetical protein LBS49_05985 [Candidatus Accumulibacter sp.]|jgi:hypothetical protein|nr:hypothetical protein [Accumulibacter sp.]